MSFDWQTEEDGEWEEQTWQDSPKTADSPKPPWRTVIIVVVLLSVVGVVIYNQVNRRLDDATAAVETDIFASHNLLSRAAAEQDVELGKAVLSGRDMGWSQTQSDLIARGLFLENPGFGLTLAETETAHEPLFREDERFIDLQLDPDLNGAELSYAREFLAFTGDGLEKVMLQQTAVYRRGETRWLLAPPMEEFWGDWQTEEQDNITFIYPLRDAETVSRLSQDLAELITEICEELPELNCSKETTIQIRFDTNPESLLEAADPANLYEANLRLDLPAPTLVGLPVDNEGYQGLLHAYGAKLAAALISHSVAYECCEHAPLFQAAMLYQLSELGLAHWPVDQQMQQTLANDGVHAEMIFQFWNSDDFSLIGQENNQRLFGFVDFLLEQFLPSKAPLWLLEEVNTTVSYQSWLVTLSGESVGTLDTVSRAWWFYSFTQSEVLTNSSQPISLPAQDLQVGCTNVAAQAEETTLYRYRLADESWEKELDYSGLAFFNPVPNDDGVVLQLVQLSEEQFWQTFLWRNGESTEIMNMGHVYSISLGQMDPNGRFLLSYFGNETDESLPEPLLIDINSCMDGGCSSIRPGQTPHWSPNGQQMLLSDNHIFDSGQYFVDGRVITLYLEGADVSSTLWLRQLHENAEDAVLIGEGAAPFWITNELFGYIQTIKSGTEAGHPRPTDQQIVVASVDSLEPQPVVDTVALQEKLPTDSPSGPLLIRYALAHPTNENLLLVMASSQPSAGYIFQVDRRAGEIKLLFPIDLSRGEHTLGFSPDGRFLVATGAMRQSLAPGEDTSSPFGALHLYDLESGEHQTILTNTEFFFPSFMFDWSLDGNWLAFARDNNVITFLAPAHDYQTMIVHEQGTCTSLAWINPLPTD